MYKHIFITDILCIILLGLLGGGGLTLWIIFEGIAFLVLFIIFAIMTIIQIFSTIYDLIDYIRYKEIEKIEKEITYLIQRAIDAEGDF